MTYRLLRDNKETGPFSEEEMITKGFKPYDLIWVEGRSAGWRYPSEIPAFKTFAPVVEEQPYDRFYKKQPPQKLFALEEKNTTSSYAPVATINEPVHPQQQPVPEPAYTEIPSFETLPGRHIHVTLPSGNTVNLTTRVSKKENKEVYEYKEPVKTIASIVSPQPVFASPVYESAISVVKETSKPVAAAATFATQENGSETVYANSTARYQQPATGFSWSLVAAAFIGVATLVGLGIMIGLAMNRDKNDMAFNEAIQHKSKQTFQPQSNNNAKTIVPPSDLPATDASEILQPAGKELVRNAVVKSTILPENSNDTKGVKKSAEQKTEDQKTSPLSNSAEAETNARPVPVAANIEKTLSLTANDFKTGAFGGISGLKYTLFNGSKFPLESVLVEVDYVQANDKVYKTERILFKDIVAGSQVTIDAPASNRGVKITSRIIKINTKETPYKYHCKVLIILSFLYETVYPYSCLMA